jgi:hypothetical protein
VGTSLAIAIGLAFASAVAVNYGYLREHDAAAALPPLSIKEPLASVRLLATNRSWLGGFATETGGFLCFVGAVALAPLALVQSLAAGGIAVLAYLTSHLSKIRLGRREHVGVAIAVAGLVLLGISLTGSTGEGKGGAWYAVLAWAGGSAVVAALALRYGPRLGAAPAYGLAAGVLFAAGDVTTKTVTKGGVDVAFLPVLFAAYGLGTTVLQLGFQRGGALTTAGTATLFTDALPIVAGTLVYREPFPNGTLGLLRGVAFALLVLGAVALTREDAMTKPGCPKLAPATEPLQRPAPPVPSQA